MMSEYAYRAFITYSHDDSRAAAWLQRSIESYRVPKRLSSSGGQASTNATNRIRPLFRDRNELPAGGDLSGQINDALRASEYLIVICSPAACASRWVNLEIAEFLKTRTLDKVLCLIVDGEPFAERAGKSPDKECFPPALGYRHSSDSTDAVEPIAADLRPEADGRRLAKQKIIAGLLGVGLDKLVQRDNQRRYWRMAAVSAASVAGMIVMTFLSLVAIDARQDEELRRAEAEDLIEFMLSDLRSRLEAVGRLDVLDAVGQRAIDYYSRVDLSDHTEDSLGRRARAFHLIGEVGDLRGDLEESRKAFNEAYDSTAELLRRSPDNGQRVFDQAQSVFWVGYLDWRLGDYDGAKSAFLEYVDLANRLVELDGDNVGWLAEVGNANINMGVYALETGDLPGAAQYFEKGRQVYTDVVEREPDNIEFRIIYAQTHAWLADAQNQAGELDLARQNRLSEAGVYRDILEDDPSNQDVHQTLIGSHRALGNLFMRRGDLESALSNFASAEQFGLQLRGLDPENTLTSLLLAQAYVDYADALGFASSHDQSRMKFAQARTLLSDLLALDSSVLEWQMLEHRMAVRRSHFDAMTGAHIRAISQLNATIEAITLLADANPLVQNIRFLLADAYLHLGVAYSFAQKPEQAGQNLARVIDELARIENLPPDQAAILANAYRLSGDLASADALTATLAETMFSHPEYLSHQQ